MGAADTRSSFREDTLMATYKRVRQFSLTDDYYWREDQRNYKLEEIPDPPPTQQPVFHWPIPIVWYKHVGTVHYYQPIGWSYGY